ncbi:hypothetical protein CFP56_024993 [Quercus suber]|uniref:Uncharacterized protein n=1 Tax=Quercus suber TaxID=58331 RepID=A0AAW0LY68_QUESU
MNKMLGRKFTFLIGHVLFIQLQ